MKSKIYLAKKINNKTWEIPIYIGELLEYNIKPIETCKVNSIMGIINTFNRNEINLKHKLINPNEINSNCFYALLLEIYNGNEIKYYTYYKCRVVYANNCNLKLESFALDDSGIISHEVSTKSLNFNKQFHDETWAKCVELPKAKN